MNTLLKNKLLQAGFILVGMSMLTACHTVKGTAVGAGQDIKSVATAVTPRKHHYVKHTSMTKKSMSHSKKEKTTSSKSTEEPTTGTETRETNTSY